MIHLKDVFVTFKIQLNQLKCTCYHLKQGELNNRQPMADENKTLTAVSDSELNSLIAVELKSGKFLLHIWDNYHIEVLQ